MVRPSAYPDVTIGDVTHGLGDADQIDFLRFTISIEKSRGVAMFQTGHTESQRCRRNARMEKGR
jgi:hypothetical protein